MIVVGTMVMMQMSDVRGQRRDEHMTREGSASPEGRIMSRRCDQAPQLAINQPRDG
jgi:hypothetical protein